MHALCDKSLFHTAVHCTWDTKTKVLSTPEDKNMEHEKKLEQAAWYAEKYCNFMSGDNAKKKGEQVCVDPETLYDLGGAHSVKYINTKPGQNNTASKGHGGSPGAPIFQLGDKMKQQEKKTEGSN